MSNDIRDLNAVVVDDLPSKIPTGAKGPAAAKALRDSRQLERVFGLVNEAKMLAARASVGA